MRIKFWNFLKNRKIIIGILIVGFFYRVYGIYFDYPLGVNSIWDESYNMSYILNLLHYKSFLLAEGPYPIFLPLLYLPVLVLRIFYLMIVHQLSSVSALYDFLIANGMGYVNIIARWYSVFFGVATIYLIYKISKLVFKNAVSAYFSASAYAVSVIAIFMAHWAKVHVAMVFFLLLSLYFALKYEENKKNKYFYFSVLASALAISIVEIGVTSVIFPLLVLAFNRKAIGLKNTVYSFFTAIFTIATFYLLNMKGIGYIFRRDFGLLAGNKFSGIITAGYFERLYYVWRDSISVEPIFIGLFIITIILAGKKLWKNIYARYILIGLMFNYLLMSTVFASPLIIRMLLGFITLSLILSAGYLGEYLQSTKLKPIAIYALFFILLIPGIYFSYRWDFILNTYTRNETVEWLKDNLNENEFAYSFDIYIDAPISLQTAKWQKDKNNISGSKKIDYILSHEEEFADRGINIIYDYYLKYDELAGENTKYVILSYWEDGSADQRYSLQTRKDAIKMLDNIKKYHSLSLVKTFYPTKDEKLINSGVDDYLNNPIKLLPLINLDKSGPFIEIYEVKT